MPCVLYILDNAWPFKSRSATEAVKIRRIYLNGALSTMFEILSTYGSGFVPLTKLISTVICLPRKTSNGLEFSINPEIICPNADGNKIELISTLKSLRPM